MPKHVLLCDDEIHILRAAEFKLKRAGYDVRTAGDGLDGWQQIQTAKPDILVTDCQMPRLDGFGLVRLVRENPQTADLPILMLTAKGYELSPQELAEKWQVRGLIAKPFSPRELLRLVETIVGPAADQTAPAPSAITPFPAAQLRTPNSEFRTLHEPAHGNLR